MKWKAEIVEQRLAGPIVRVLFENVSGDAAAAPVGDAMREVIDAHRPSAFVIDLTRAHYSGGDGICGLVVAHLVPLAIVAHDGDWERIHRTLQITGLLQIFGGKLFSKEDDALQYLNRRLEAAG